MVLGGCRSFLLLVTTHIGHFAGRKPSEQLPRYLQRHRTLLSENLFKFFKTLDTLMLLNP